MGAGAVSAERAEKAAPAKRLFVGANWKCSLETVEQVDQLLSSIATAWEKAESKDLELCIFAPYVFLERARRILPKEICVGSQNAWDAAEGFACTGVVTSAMLKGIGCDWVLLGHSDRRNVLGESHELIGEKVRRCLESGLKVNITIGEKKEAREKGQELQVLQEQLESVAQAVPSDAWDRIAVAYEPVWAVGEGAVPCEPNEAQRVHSALRQWLKEKFGENTSKCLFLYTGSVNEGNAEHYAALPDVDGFVVGRAGLDVEKLSAICRTLVSCKGGT